MTLEIGIVLALAGLASGAFWRVWALIAEARKVGEDAQKDLAAYKTDAALTFATKAGLTEALTRVHDSLDRLTNRIDTLIAATQKPPPRRL